MKMRPLRLLAILALLVVACAPDWIGPAHEARHIASTLDDAEDFIARWGTVNASEVLFIEDQGYFALDYERDVKEYVQQARGGVQGGAAQLVQRAFSSRTGAKVAPEGPAPTLEEATLPERPADLGTLATDRFQALGALLGDLEPALSERDAMLVGFSHKQTEQLVRYLVNPKSVPTNLKVYLGIGQISVAPGWQTRKRYVADVAVTTTYAARTADEIDWEDRWPAYADETVQCNFLDDQRSRAIRQCAVEAKATVARTKAEKAKAEKAKAEKAKADRARTDDATAPADDPQLWEHMEQAERADCEGRVKARFATWFGLGPGKASASGSPGDSKGSKDGAKLETVEELTPEALASVVGGSCSPRFPTWITADTKSGSVLQPGFPQPRFLAVFPLVESQTLELTAGSRSQLALSTYLAATFEAAGVPAAAQTLNEYVERAESDAATRTPLPVVSGYARGATFGYRVQPAFTAIADPTRKTAASDFVLQPISVPYFVVMVTEQSEADTWKHVALKVSQRWTRLEHRSWAGTFFVDVLGHGHTFPDLTNEARAASARAVDLAFDEIAQAIGARRASNLRSPLWLDDLRWRYRMVEDLIATPVRYTSLPSTKPGGQSGSGGKSGSGAKTCTPEPLVITAVVPQQIWVNADSVLAVAGKHFKACQTPQVKKVLLGNRACAVEVLGDASLVASCPATSPGATSVPRGTKTPVVLVAAHDVESEDVPAKVLAGARPPAQPRIELTRDASGRITSATLVDAGARQHELLSRIVAGDAERRALEKACGGASRLCVDVTAGSQ